MAAHAIPVRYVEVDQLGVVFNAWYLVYFDEAMTAWLAAGGLPYSALRAAGYDVVLVRTEIDWRGSLRFGETAEIEVACEHIGRTSFTLGFDVRREGLDVAHGRTVYVVVDAAGGGKREVPARLRAVLSAT